MAEVDHRSARSVYSVSPSSSSSTCSTTLSMADRLETMYSAPAPSPPLDCPPPKKRRVNFSLTLDIKQETSDDACVPQGNEVSDAESYYSDLPAMPTTPHGGPQVPPLTPGTNLKVGEALRATYASWNDKTRQLGIPRDPRIWEDIEVVAWLDWAAQEFQLYSDTVTSFISTFRMTGREMCSLSKEDFCRKAPMFVGDILWEHLVLLQQDVDREKLALRNTPSKLSETCTDPSSLRPRSQTPPLERKSPYPTSHSPYPSSHSPYPPTSHSPYPTSHSPYPPTSHSPYPTSHSPQKTYTSLDAPKQISPPLKHEFKSEYPSSQYQQSAYPQYPAISQYQAYPSPYHPYQSHPYPPTSSFPPHPSLQADPRMVSPSVLQHYSASAPLQPQHPAFQVGSKTSPPIHQYQVSYVHQYQVSYVHQYQVFSVHQYQVFSLHQCQVFSLQPQFGRSRYLLSGVSLP